MRRYPAYGAARLQRVGDRLIEPHRPPLSPRRFERAFAASAARTVATIRSCETCQEASRGMWPGTYAVGGRDADLKTGPRCEARGAYRFSDDQPDLPVPVHLVSAFELLHHGSGDSPPTCLHLVVPFQVTVRTDGKVIAGLDDPRLLPCPGG